MSQSQEFGDHGGMTRGGGLQGGYRGCIGGLGFKV